MVAGEGPQVDWERQADKSALEFDHPRVENRCLPEDLDAARSRGRLLAKQLNQQDTQAS